MSDGKFYCTMRFEDDPVGSVDRRYWESAGMKLVYYLNTENIPREDIVSIQAVYDCGVVITLIYRA